MIGKLVGALISGAIGKKQKKKRPVAGVIIGAGTMFAARRLFPQRYAVIAATAAAAYLTKKWAESAQSVAARKAANPQVTEPDGQKMGDALPPEIPLAKKGKGKALD